jgi:hypothetical protein
MYPYIDLLDPHEQIPPLKNIDFARFMKNNVAGIKKPGSKKLSSSPTLKS